MKAASKSVRCAIYVRKSSEEGLDQDYNSLHAQADACRAYVLSQAGEGWSALSKTYEDGGYSGGSMDRPGLKQLLADIEAGHVDVIVVYKVDRLTRSLADFARIIETLDKAGASFVSVTQAFNTTTSMGRLTLNVLLSFAQFEREVTGERIRDKIAASKQKGLWMGGNLALGYDPNGRTLTINPAEADIVRLIFRRYLELGSVHALRAELEEQGVRSKRVVSQAGNVRGGVPMNRGALFHLLRNRLYLGEIPHKGRSYPGQHDAIIDQATFDAVQAHLNERAQRTSNPRRGAQFMLTGRIIDSAGHPMSPVSAAKRGGATYRYYVSSPALNGEAHKAGTPSRVSASLVEKLLAERLMALAGQRLTDVADFIPLVTGVTVWGDGLRVRLSSAFADRFGGEAAIRRRLPSGDDLRWSDEGLELAIAAPLAKIRGRAAVRIVADDQRAPDPALINALARAESWKRRLLTGDAPTVEAIAQDEGVTAFYVGRVLRMAFLAPELKRDILDGRGGLNLQAVMTRDVPLSWAKQGARVPTANGSAARNL